MDDIIRISDISSASAALKATNATKTPADTGEFSKVLADTLQQNVISLTASPSGDSSLGNRMDTDSTIEMLMANAVRTGDMGDTEMALFMLCTMMQGSGEDSDLSPILQMMATMISDLQGDTTQVKTQVLQSDYSPEILSTIDSVVFNTANPPQMSMTGSAIIPAEAWKPTSPAIVSDQNNRSPSTLRQVIDQFDVEHSERYTPYRRGGDTYCNIFLWDVTSALNCEIPHFVNAETGVPRGYPDIKGATELNAVATEDWLTQFGPNYGWRETNAATAQDYANQGKAAVTTAGTIGHVQVVCPSADGGFDPIRGVTVAQSGSKNTSYTHLSGIFGSSSMSKVRYFIHD